MCTWLIKKDGKFESYYYRTNLRAKKHEQKIISDYLDDQESVNGFRTEGSFTAYPIPEIGLNNYGN